MGMKKPDSILDFSRIFLAFKEYSNFDVSSRLVGQSVKLLIFDDKRGISFHYYFTQKLLKVISILFNYH